MKEPQESIVDKFLERHVVYIGFVLIAVNFGIWQKNFNAGGFILVTCATLHTLYRQHRLEVWQEKEIEWKVNELASQVQGKRMEHTQGDSGEITH